MTKPILTLAFFGTGAVLFAVALQRPTSAAPLVLDEVAVSVAVPPVVTTLSEVVVVASPRLAVALARLDRPATRREWTRPLEPCWTPSGNVRVWDTQP